MDRSSDQVTASVILVIVGFMESLTLGKVMADRNNYRINVKREVIALSASNILGSMFSCYYSGGSFSRTALNDVLGPKSNIHGLVQSALLFKLDAVCCTDFLLSHFHANPAMILPNATAIAVLFHVLGL